MRNGEARQPRGQRGYTYTALIFIVLVFSIIVLANRTGEVTRTRLSEEKALLSIGHQFRNALANYVQASNASGVDAYPTSLQDMVEDRRFSPAHHELRKLFNDPITGQAQWGLVQVNGHIIGIYSKSPGKPLQQLGFDGDDSGLNGADKYSDWIFTWPATAVAAAPAADSGS